MSPTGTIEGLDPEDLVLDEISPKRVPAVPEWRREPEWEGRDLFVAFPCYKQTNPVTAWCLVALALDLGKSHVRFDMEIGDAMIYHARNRLAMKFLETDAQWLLFIDDDMILPIGRPVFLQKMARLPASYSEKASALHVAHRLMSHKRDLVGATYFSRHVRGRAINSLHGGKEYTQKALEFHDGTMDCDWVGTGCMLVHRRVFEMIQKKFPELAPQNDEMPWNFFQPETDGRGEDIAFCARARECGVQPCVDTMLHAIHVGYGTYGIHTSTLNELDV